MNQTIKIAGKVVYQEIGMGFWGIIGNDGQEWLPINLPISMQVKNKRVAIKAKVLKDAMNMYMWGTMIEIV